MKIKYSDVIIAEIKARGPIAISAASVNGDEFEKWLYEETNMSKKGDLKIDYCDDNKKRF